MLRCARSTSLFSTVAFAKKHGNTTQEKIATKPISKNLRLDEFDQISITAPVRVMIKSNQKATSVFVKGPADDLDQINFAVKDHELRIHSHRTMTFNNNDEVDITINLPQLNKLTLDGAAKADVSGVTSKNLEVVVDNNASLNMRGKNIGLRK